MIDKNQKKILIFIGIIFIIIIILVLILNKTDNNSNEPNKPNENTNQNIPEHNFQTTITRLNDLNTYFRINNIMNDFYNTLKNKDANTLIDILEDYYKTSNSININNVLNYFPNDYNSPSFITEEIYYNANSNVTYYFLNGYLINYDFNGDNTYTNNLKYLIIINNNHYVIRPLNNDINLEEYAKSYNLKEISISNNSTIKSVNPTEENKLSLYLTEYFNHFLFYDINKAYNMLSSHDKYNDITSLENDLANIFNNYSTNIFSYHKQVYPNYTEYKIIDDKQNNITIKEYNIMDFTITF